MEKNELFRNIPKVDVLLERESMAALIGRYGRALVTEAVREETDRLRRIIQTEDEAAARRALEGLEKAVEDRLAAMCAPRVRKVINATGTILHTNLGRAPISREQAEKLARYHEMLVEANARFNLTRVSDDAAETIDRNYLDCLAPLRTGLPGVARAVEALLLAASVALGVYVGLEVFVLLGGIL